MGSASSEFVVDDAYQYDMRAPGHWLLSHVMRYKLFLLGILLCAIANATGAFTLPMLVGAAFSYFLKGQPELAIIGGYALLMAVLQVVRGLFLVSRNACAETVAQRLERDVRGELYASLLGKSMTFHSMQSVGDIMARATNDVREMNLMMNPGVNLMIGSSMFLIVPLFLVLGLHPHLLLAPALFIVCYVFALRYYASTLRPVTETVRARFGAMNAKLAEAIDGIETVKGASQEEQESQRFYSNANAFRDAFVQQSNIEARFIPLLLLGITTGTAFLHAILLFRANLLDVGQVIAYMGYLQMFGFPTYISLYGFSSLSLGMAAARRIFKIISTQTSLDENREGYLAPIQGAIRFENVTFGYPGAANPALQNVSFEAKPGQIIAVVGQTGAGKSTLARLVNRTYDPTAGRVLIDGRNLYDWQLESLRSQISIIEQDIFLFSRTIAENIAFGKPGAAQEEIEAAARSAQAHDFIMGFKEGYKTVVGGRGVTLSGGQRQRIALARAFLTSPRILILDDSTSAIDSATEDQIQRAIYQATKGRTTFLITHRLSQIRWADQIIVLRKGVVAAIGTHEELLKISEPYRRIFATYEGLSRTLEKGYNR